MEYFVFLVYHSLIHLKMCSQWYDRHVFQAGDTLKVLLLLRGTKHVFPLSQFQKECKIEKGVQRCVATEPTPGEKR